jgi:asparagine synthase (glutamine-hydrolysing)
MCGIYGLIQYTQCQATRRRVLENVLKTQGRMRHRGPDWEGRYESKNDDNVFMAHHRLSIIDPAGGGQPIVWSIDENDKDWLALAVNGEIYNYEELETHKGHNLREIYNFKTKSDCECIMSQYQFIMESINRECVSKIYSGTSSELCESLLSIRIPEMLNSINGMFAFILYDNINKMILVARDPFGICPLYYGFDSYGGIHFASEMKAMPDDVIPQFFLGGHYMYFSTGELTEKPMVRKYYTKLDDVYNSCVHRGIYKEGITVSDEELQIQMNNCRKLLTDAVSARLRTDVPFGMLLSGGLDSSLVCSIACKLLRSSVDNNLKTHMDATRQISTFCIGLEGSPDLQAAEKVAKFLGTKHYGFTFTIEEGIQAIRNVIWHLETYDSTTILAATPMFLLSRKIKAMGIKMVLSGEGSDESGAGYLYFLKAPSSQALASECLRRVKELQYADNLRANKSTMAWGLEARVPFQNKAFVEWAIGLPSYLKTKNGIEKWIYRKSFDTYTTDGYPEYLPPDLLWRVKNQFSDISDTQGRTWIGSMEQLIENEISDYVFSFASERFPHNTPTQKKEYYFRSIFEELFPGRGREFTVHKSTPNTEWEGVYYDSSGKGYQDAMGSDVYDESRRN